MFLGLTNLKYIAYADDLLLISRTQSSLIKSTQLVSRSFEEIGLRLNTENCGYSVFDTKHQSGNLVCGSFQTVRGNEL